MTTKVLGYVPKPQLGILGQKYKNLRILKRKEKHSQTALICLLYFPPLEELSSQSDNPPNHDLPLPFP